MSDPRIEAAIEHWAPRYVENGVPIGDFLEVTGSIRSWDDWCAAWTAVGARHESNGDAALAEGHGRTAAQHFVTAAVCYHFGKFLFLHDMEQMRATHEAAVRAHRKAHPLLDPPVERVEFPYLGTHVMVGNLRKPAGIDRPPVVLMYPGLDSAKEELTSNEAFFLDRGMATFTMDGPGQGESEYELPIEPHSEGPAGAAIDALEARDDLDTDRIGGWGVSLGGYYIIRAVAFEKRIKAAVSLSGPFRWMDDWPTVPPMSRLAGKVRSHSKTDEEAEAVVAKFDLTDVIANVTCPVYVLGGDQDRIITPRAAHQIVAGVSGPSVLNMVEGGNHVVSNKTYLYRPQSADWMAEQLGASG